MNKCDWSNLYIHRQGCTDRMCDDIKFFIQDSQRCGLHCGGLRWKHSFSTEESVIMDLLQCDNGHRHVIPLESAEFIRYVFRKLDLIFDQSINLEAVWQGAETTKRSDLVKTKSQTNDD